MKFQKSKDPVVAQAEQRFAEHAANGYPLIRDDVAMRAGQVIEAEIRRRAALQAPAEGQVKS